MFWSGSIIDTFTSYKQKLEVTARLSAVRKKQKFLALYLASRNKLTYLLICKLSTLSVCDYDPNLLKSSNDYSENHPNRFWELWFWDLTFRAFLDTGTLSPCEFWNLASDSSVWTLNWLWQLPHNVFHEKNFWVLFLKNFQLFNLYFHQDYLSTLTTTFCPIWLRHFFKMTSNNLFACLLGHFERILIERKLNTEMSKTSYNWKMFEVSKHLL